MLSDILALHGTFINILLAAITRLHHASLLSSY